MKPGQAASSVHAWILPENKPPVPVPTQYDPATHRVLFALSNASRFMVGVWINPFVDIKTSDPFYNAVEYQSVQGIMNGTTATTFSPKSYLTRAQMLAILYQMAGSPEVTAAGNHWYARPQAWAIANGISDGSKMEAIITREQLAAIIYRYEQKQGGGFTGQEMFQPSQADLTNVSHWAYEGVAWCRLNGVLELDDGKIDPEGKLTRAQTAIIMMRYSSRSSE